MQSIHPRAKYSYAQQGRKVVFVDKGETLVNIETVDQMHPMLCCAQNAVCMLFFLNCEKETFRRFVIMH